MPPPTHGVSVTNSQIYESELVNNIYQKKLIRLNLSYQIQELRRFSIKKTARLISIYIKLLKALVIFKPDAVYFSIMPLGTGFWKDAFLVILIKLFQPKIIFHIHNFGIKKYYVRPLYRLLYRLVFNNSSIVHLSQKLANSELIPCNFRKAQIFVCNNAVKGFSHLTKTSVENHTVRILFFSNLFLFKGIDIALQMAIGLIKKDVNFKLVFGGSATKEFQTLFAQYQLENPEIEAFIELHTSCNSVNKEELFGSSDLFIFPSIFSEECMPLVIIEAMSAELPIIGSNLGAIDELIQNEQNGFLIPPNNHSALIERVELLAKDRSLRRKMGEHSKKIFLKKFTLIKQEERMHEILKSQLD